MLFVVPVWARWRLTPWPPIWFDCEDLSLRDDLSLREVDMLDRPVSGLLRFVILLSYQLFFRGNVEQRKFLECLACWINPVADGS